MSWVTAIWSMTAGACLTLAAMHLFVAYRIRPPWPSLLFSITAIATAAYVYFELRMLGSHTAQEYALALSWARVSAWFVVVSLVAFLHVYLGTGRPWLALSIIGLRTFALALNFSTGENVNFLAIAELHHVIFLGDSVSIPVGKLNPLVLIGHTSLILLVIYVLDASVGAWRRGDRIRAILLGPATAFFVIAATGQVILVFWGVIEMPLVVAPFYLGIVLAMASELGRDVVRASRLSYDLRESEALMALAVESANLGILVRDVQRNTLWASRLWREMFDFGACEPLEIAAILGKVHSDDRNVLQQAMDNAANSQGRYQVEFRLVLTDGAFRWIYAQGRVELDNRGQLLRTRGACSDITARKQSEQDMLRLRQQIAHVGRVSVMGQFASTLAHEINQQLGAILRNAEAAAIFLQAQTPDLDEIRAIVNDIREDDQRAGAVIDRMRGLLKRHDIELHALDVGALLVNLETLVRPEAIARHVKLWVEVENDLPQILADSVFLQQVLLNLISNGLDSIDESNKSTRRIVLSAQCEGATNIQIKVSDSGMGIAPGALEQVFDSFFTSKKGGMGMGLSISRDLVEAQGGRIWAENNEEGASLIFTLQAAPEGTER